MGWGPIWSSSVRWTPVGSWGWQPERMRPTVQHYCLLQGFNLGGQEPHLTSSSQCPAQYGGNQRCPQEPAPCCNHGQNAWAHQGSCSLEALLQNLRSVGLHPSSWPIGSAAGKAVSSGDSRVSVEQDSEGFKDRGALLVAD